MGYQRHHSPSLIQRGFVTLMSPVAGADFTQIETPLLHQEEAHAAALTTELKHPDERLHVLAHELTTPFQIGTAQKFGAVHLNRSAEASGKWLVQLNGFMTNVTRDDERLRLFHLARAFPDYHILAVDQPSGGLSDNYTSTQQRQFFVEGDMSGVGKVMHDSIDAFLQKQAVGSTALRTASLGSRQAIDVVLHGLSHPEGIRFEQWQGVEIPGTAPYSRRMGIHAAYMGYETMQSRRLNENAPWVDVFKHAAFLPFIAKYGNPQAETNLPDIYKKDLLTSAWNMWNTPLGRTIGHRLFTDAVESGLPVTRMVGGASRIDKVADAKECLREVDGRFFLPIVDGLSHAGLGHLAMIRAVSALSAQLIEEVARGPQPTGVRHIDLSMEDQIVM